MPNKNRSLKSVILIAVMLTGLFFISACNPAATQTTPAPGLQTMLLVESPDNALPADRPVNVLSRTMDAVNKVSHVELYAVQWPNGQGELLIRSDAAPFDQTTFTASQIFTPTAPGHYVIKVVGYNKRGEKRESDYLGFDVTD